MRSTTEPSSTECVGLVAFTFISLGGCAGARFEAAIQACEPAAETDPADALGYADVHEPPSGALTGGAAKNHEAAPPWVVGQERVYPFDPDYSYQVLVRDPGRVSTPLLCRMSYDRKRRRALFAADPLTNVELSAVYEVPGKSPAFHVHGASQTPSAVLVDAATALAPGDEIRLAVVDRDSRWGIDDPLVDFALSYEETGTATAASQLWRGAVEVACAHLDPAAAREAFEDALAAVDAGLGAWDPELLPESWDFGLFDAGMHGMRATLELAASLQLQGWDAPEVRERGQRLLAHQLCFERAAAPEVARVAARVARRDPVGLRHVRIEGTAYACEPSPSGAPVCRLTAAVTNTHDEGSSPLAYASYVRLVLAGGREIPLTIEHSVFDGQTHEDFYDLPAGATATVIYRLDVPLREDAELARPVLLRDRRRRLFSQENLVEDLALRLARDPV